MTRKSISLLIMLQGWVLENDAQEGKIGPCELIILISTFGLFFSARFSVILNHVYLYLLNIPFNKFALIVKRCVV